MKEIGPELHREPERFFHVCTFCQYHKCTGSLHIRIGPGGWREYACTHPLRHAWSIGGVDRHTAENAAWMDGRWAERDIGKTEKTPPWCPELHEETKTKT